MRADRDGRRWLVWTAGLIVVVAAGAATAHGLYEVAIGSRTPPGIAWLYPVITDGLALVAYAATTRLAGPSRRYAWTVVVLAAGLSGLAQATYLAGAVGEAPQALRFGVGAWPAIAAAVAAHLLYLIGSGVGPQSASPVLGWDGRCPTVPPGVQVDQAGVQPDVPTDHPEGDSDAALGSSSTPRERALDTAERHRVSFGELPSVRELEVAAGVSRGTAHRALQELRSTVDDRTMSAQPVRDRLDGYLP